MADEITTRSRPEDTKVNRTQAKALLRFFSVESDINMAPTITASPKLTYSFYSKIFLLKVAQLFSGIICIGLYVEGVKIMMNSVTFLCFSCVVFGSSIIISAVIILSYILDQPMPQELVRVFIAIHMILYFISATVTITIWCNKKVEQIELQLAKICILLQAVLSYINFLLFSIEMFLSIKKAVAFET